jgi:hypothetical protein
MIVNGDEYVLAYHYKYNIYDAYLVNTAITITFLLPYGNKIISGNLDHDFMVYYEIEMQHLNAIPFIALDSLTLDTVSEKEQYFSIETININTSTYKTTEESKPYYKDFNITRSSHTLAIEEVMYKLNPLIIHTVVNDTLINTDQFTYITKNENLYVIHEDDPYVDANNIKTIRIISDEYDNILRFEGVPVENGEHYYQFNVQTTIVNQFEVYPIGQRRPIHVIAKQ